MAMSLKERKGWFDSPHNSVTLDSGGGLCGRLVFAGGIVAVAGGITGGFLLDLCHGLDTDLDEAASFNLLCFHWDGRYYGGNFLGRGRLERWGKHTECRSTGDITFMLVLVL